MIKIFLVKIFFLDFSDKYIITTLFFLIESIFYLLNQSVTEAKNVNIYNNHTANNFKHWK